MTDRGCLLSVKIAWAVVWIMGSGDFEALNYLALFIALLYHRHHPRFQVRTHGILFVSATTVSDPT